MDVIPWDEVKFSRSAKALSRSSGFPVALGTLKWEEFPQRASAGEGGGGGGWIRNCCTQKLLKGKIMDEEVLECGEKLSQRVDGFQDWD